MWINRSPKVILEYKVRVRQQKNNVHRYAHVFPLEVKRDPCSGIKIIKDG